MGIKMNFSPREKNNITRQQHKKVQKYWAVKKQESRDRLYAKPQKHRRFKEQDRGKKKIAREKAKEQKEKKKEKVQADLVGDDGSPPGPSGIQVAKKTVYNKASQLRKDIGKLHVKTSEEFGQVLGHVIKTSTPRKRKSFEKHSEHTTLTTDSKKRKMLDDFVGVVAKSKETCKKIMHDQRVRKHAQQLLIDATGYSRKTVSRARKCPFRKARRDRVPVAVKKKVEKFYMRPEISREMPHKRFTTKHGSAFFMQITVTSAYKLFLQENPDIKIGFTRFSTLRPIRVRLLSLQHREYCLCPYCINIKFKVHALNLAITASSSNITKIADEKEFVDMLLCDKEPGEKFHKLQCVMGKCEKCKDVEGTIMSYYADLLEIEQDVTWNHWENTTKDGKVRRSLITHRKPFADILRELVSDVTKPALGTTFMSHLFVANWQAHQFQHLKETLPPNWVLLVMDFSRNRVCSYQDEIKSAYFGKRQVTMHPTVVYYKGNDDKVCRESHIFLSDDVKHDFHAANYFLEKSLDMLKDTLEMEIKHVVVFSDGAASQYKSRGPLADLSLSNISMERSFFGSEHGKSESDGETGVINKAVDRAVVGRRVVINDAKDTAEWCNANLARDGHTGFSRKFILVDVGEINRDRPETDVKTVSGIRKLHQVKNMNENYHILVRSLSCYCEGCKDMQSNGPCVNANYVENFKEVTIGRSITHVDNRDKEDGDDKSTSAEEEVTDSADQGIGTESNDRTDDHTVENGGDKVDDNGQDKIASAERETPDGDTDGGTSESHDQTDDHTVENDGDKDGHKSSFAEGALKSNFWYADIPVLGKSSNEVKRYVVEVESFDEINHVVWVRYWKPVVSIPDHWNPPGKEAKKYTLNITELVEPLTNPTPVAVLGETSRRQNIYYVFSSL